jgi:hypothetical protein
MSLCSHCNTKVEKGAQFCTKCGSRVTLSIQPMEDVFFALSDDDVGTPPKSVYNVLAITSMILSGIFVLSEFIKFILAYFIRYPYLPVRNLFQRFLQNPLYPFPLSSFFTVCPLVAVLFAVIVLNRRKSKMAFVSGILCVSMHLLITFLMFITHG